MQVLFLKHFHQVILMLFLKENNLVSFNLWKIILRKSAFESLYIPHFKSCPQVIMMANRADGGKYVCQVLLSRKIARSIMGWWYDYYTKLGGSEKYFFCDSCLICNSENNEGKL